MKKIKALPKEHGFIYNGVQGKSNINTISKTMYIPVISK